MAQVEKSNEGNTVAEIVEGKKAKKNPLQSAIFKRLKQIQKKSDHKVGISRKAMAMLEELCEIYYEMRPEQPHPDDLKDPKYLKFDKQSLFIHLTTIYDHWSSWFVTKKINGIIRRALAAANANQRPRIIPRHVQVGMKNQRSPK